MTKVKICGVTTPEVAEWVVAAGADAIGLNFYPPSPRCVDEAGARAIVEAIAGRVLTVGVFVDVPSDEVARIKQHVGLGCVQLHGQEPPEALVPLLPHAYKALRVRGPATIADAERFPGEHILLDAFVPGEPGGTGARFDWRLAADLARTRKVTLAGGLTPDNVGQAIAVVKPYCVDVASGVEQDGRKDPTLVRAFIAAARR